MFEVKKAVKEESAVSWKWTGITNVRVISINPSKDDAEDLGIKVFNDEYLGEDDKGNAQLRIDVHVESADENKVKNKITFYIKDELVPESRNTPGTFQFIDNEGNACYGADENSLKPWVDHTTARRSKSGESTLADFIKNWVLNKGDECIFDVKELISTEARSLKDLIKAADASDRLVRVLYAINEKGFITVYGRKFARQLNTELDSWMKEMGNTFTKGKFPPKSYQSNFEFIPFDNTNPENMKVVDDSPVATVIAEGKEGETEDDLPF